MTPIDLTITGHRAESFDGDCLPFWLLDFTLNGEEHTVQLDEHWMLDRTTNDDIRQDFSDEAEEALEAAIAEYVAEHEADLSFAEHNDAELAELAAQLRERSNLDYDLHELPGDQGYELRLPIHGAWRRVTAYANAAYAYRGLQQVIEETAPVLKRLNANIPQALHDTFKITCAQRKKVMGDVVIELIRDWCQPPLSAVEDPDGILQRCVVELSAAESQRLIDAGRHVDDLDDTVRDWSRDELLEFARYDAQHSTFRAMVDGYMIDQQTGDDLDFALSGPAKSALYAHAYAVCVPVVLQRLVDLLDA